MYHGCLPRPKHGRPTDGEKEDDHGWQSRPTDGEGCFDPDPWDGSAIRGDKLWVEKSSSEVP